MAHNQVVLSSLPAIRPIGGAENNLVDPSLNATPGSSETRIGPQNFGQIGENARTISNIVSSGPGAEARDASHSAWLYVFGQFLDHDLDLEHPNSANPLDIQVPAGDPDLADGSVIPLGGKADLDSNGNIVNTIAGYLDLSQVYGSDAANAASLRNADGTLKTSDGNALSVVNGQFVAGDVRVAENPELVAVTTLFVREHNRLVGQLAEEHPGWTGDQLYDGARALNTAQYQNVVYNEFLPALIGKDAISPYLGYDPSVSSQVSAEFSAGAFRVGHSQVSGMQEGIDNNGEVTFTQSLADSFFNTPQQTVAKGIDNLLRHVSSDPSQATDVFAVNELRNLLAAPPQAIDLIAIDIERTRDVGLGTLNQTRVALGLPAYTALDQITQDPDVVSRLQQAYDTIDDVDLFVGGIAEDHAPRSTVGPTFQAIIGQQFDAIRTGDRFYWQNQGFDTATSKRIESTTLSDILSRNSDTPNLQAHVFDTAERHLSAVPTDEPDGPQLVIGVDDDDASVAGGPSDDTIFAGQGLHQTLTGSGGSDVFVFSSPGRVNDTVSDFDPANDQLDLRGAISGTDVVSIQAEVGGTLLHVSSYTIHLPGVDPSTITGSDFAQGVTLQTLLGHA